MPYLSIQQASEELRSGLITPTELLAETLDCIDQLDSDIQAFVTVLRDQAYEEAEKAENEQRTGLFRSPLHGIPIAIKDLIAVKDVLMTAGSKVLADYVPQGRSCDCRQNQYTRVRLWDVYTSNTQSLGPDTYRWRLQRWFGGSIGRRYVPWCYR